MNLFEKLTQYLRETREEASKVAWPTRQETIRYSALVIGASIIVGVFFATLDFGFTKLVDVTITARNTSRAAATAPAAAPATVTPDTTAAPAATPPGGLNVNSASNLPIKVETSPASDPLK